MLDIAKTTKLSLKRTPLLCGLLFAAVLALLPISARAQCANWDASGVLFIIQREQYYTRFTLQQNDRQITGTAYQIVSGHGRQGNVEGTLDGDRFSVQVFWNNGLQGVYYAKVLPTGRLDGEAYEKKTPNVRHLWHSHGVLKCIPPSPPPIVSPPKPATKVLKATGKARTTEPAAAPPMKVPGIVASQPFFPPNLSIGLVTLTWDGGPDHPYAEVWFKVNNGEEVRLVEKGKGLQTVPVERGKAYTYILTDDGKTLATVVFTAN